MDILHVFSDRIEDGYRYTVIYRDNRREFVETSVFDEKRGMREIIRKLSPVSRPRMEYERLSPAGKSSVDGLMMTRDYGSASTEYEYGELKDYCARDRNYSMQTIGKNIFDIDDGLFIGVGDMEYFTFPEGYCMQRHILVRQDYIRLTDLSLSVRGLYNDYVLYQDAGQEYVLETHGQKKSLQEWLGYIKNREPEETIARSAMNACGAAAFDILLKEGETSLREFAHKVHMEIFEVKHQLRNTNVDMFTLNRKGLFQIDGSYLRFVPGAVEQVELSKGYFATSGLLDPGEVYVGLEADSGGAKRSARSIR